MLSLFQRNIQMLARQSCRRSGNQYNRLGVVNDHRGAFQLVADREVWQQIHRRVVYAANTFKVRAVRRVGLLAVNGATLQLLDFGEDRLAQRVECLAYSTYLCKAVKQPPDLPLFLLCIRNLYAFNLYKHVFTTDSLSLEF